MTDVQPNPDREQDPETNTPQPDENPQQRKNLQDQAQRQPGKDDPAPASAGCTLPATGRRWRPRWLRDWKLREIVVTGTRPDPDRDPNRPQPGKVDQNGLGQGEDSLQKQAAREASLDQSGDKQAADFLSDENGNLTKIQADTVPEGDPQEQQRGQGQQIPS